MGILDTASSAPVKWVSAREWYSTLRATTVTIPETTVPRKTIKTLLTGEAIKIEDPVLGTRVVVKLAPTVYLELHPHVYTVTNDFTALPQGDGLLLPHGSTVTLTL